MFSKNLKRLRLEKGLTQVQLAKSIGVGQSTLNYWENGKSDITSFYLVKLCTTLKVSADELLGIDPMPATSEEIIEISGILNQLGKEDQKNCVAVVKTFLNHKKLG